MAIIRIRDHDMYNNGPNIKHAETGWDSPMQCDNSGRLRIPRHLSGRASLGPLQEGSCQGRTCSYRPPFSLNPSP